MCVSSGVIVGDFNLECVTIAPYKTDAPLFIDADAVLAKSATFQLLKTIPGRLRKVSERARSVDDEKLSGGRTQNGWR
jgi:hypothetical protein